MTGRPITQHKKIMQWFADELDRVKKGVQTAGKLALA